MSRDPPRKEPVVRLTVHHQQTRSLAVHILDDGRVGLMIDEEGILLTRVRARQLAAALVAAADEAEPSPHPPPEAP